MEQSNFDHEDERHYIRKKRFWVLIVIVFLVIYFLFGGVWGNLIGLAQSDSLEENRVDMGEMELVFINESYEKLFDVYYENIELEFKACLLGFIDENYYVNEVYFPKMSFQSVNRVVSTGCPTGTLIDLHSHPDKHCLFSETDINSFESSKEEFTVMAVLCEEDRFNFYQ